MRQDQGPRAAACLSVCICACSESSPGEGLGGLPPPTCPRCLCVPGGRRLGETCSRRSGDLGPQQKLSCFTELVGPHAGPWVRGCGQAAWDQKGLRCPRPVQEAGPSSALLCVSPTPSFALALGIRGPVWAGPFSQRTLGPSPLSRAPAVQTQVWSMAGGASHSPRLCRAGPGCLEFRCRVAGAGGKAGAWLSPPGPPELAPQSRVNAKVQMAGKCPFHTHGGLIEGSFPCSRWPEPHPSCLFASVLGL